MRRVKRLDQHSQAWWTRWRKQRDRDLPSAASLREDATPHANVHYLPIVSFPKSGNTYAKAIVARLLFGQSYSVVPDAHKHRIENGSEFLKENGERLRVFKSHFGNNAHGRTDQNIQIASVLWIRRHPLDVFLSFRNYLLLRASDLPDPSLFARHRFCENYVEARKALTDEEDITNMFFCFLVYGTLMPEFRAVGNWFSHAKYWLDYSQSHPCHALKYEDLVEDPIKTMSGFAGDLGFGEKELEDAVIAARVDTKLDGKFFWKQRAFNYREAIPAELIDKWYRLYGEDMALFGYGSR